MEAGAAALDGPGRARREEGARPESVESGVAVWGAEDGAAAVWVAVAGRGEVGAAEAEDGEEDDAVGDDVRMTVSLAMSS